MLFFKVFTYTHYLLEATWIKWFPFMKQSGQGLHQSLKMWTLPLGTLCTSHVELKAIPNQKSSGSATSMFNRKQELLPNDLFHQLLLCLRRVHVLEMDNLWTIMVLISGWLIVQEKRSHPPVESGQGRCVFGPLTLRLLSSAIEVNKINIFVILDFKRKWNVSFPLQVFLLY